MNLRHNFVQQSLELHLFFGRIMKEHSFFLELGFTPRDHHFTQKAEAFRKEFDKLLWEAASLSYGIISEDVLHSGEVVTPYTLEAERVTSFYTGIDIPFEITQAEAALESGRAYHSDSTHEKRVYELNQRYIFYVTELIKFKSEILSNVVSCKMFTQNYPLLIDHILREAKLYLKMIQALQSGKDLEEDEDILEQEIFWDRIMAEHSKFIRGLLDPTENALIETANDFGNTFDKLTEEAQAAMDRTVMEGSVTEDTLEATNAIRDFKAQGTQGLIECKVKSIIIPLLGDHTLREASHFLRLLKSFKGTPYR